jgi:hypothetical protein
VKSFWTTDGGTAIGGVLALLSYHCLKRVDELKSDVDAQEHGGLTGEGDIWVFVRAFAICPNDRQSEYPYSLRMPTAEREP